MNHSLGHLSVAVDAFEVFESGCLYFPCPNHAFSNVGTRLAWCCFRDVLEGNRAYLALYVYSVEQRTRYFVHVSLNLAWCTDATMSRVAIISARTWIHARHKHEGAWIVYRVFGSADIDVAVFQRLAQYFQGGFAELWELTKPKILA